MAGSCVTDLRVRCDREASCAGSFRGGRRKRFRVPGVETPGACQTGFSTSAAAARSADASLLECSAYGYHRDANLLRDVSGGTSVLLVLLVLLTQPVRWHLGEPQSGWTNVSIIRGGAAGVVGVTLLSWTSCCTSSTARAWSLAAMALGFRFEPAKPSIGATARTTSRAVSPGRRPSSSKPNSALLE